MEISDIKGRLGILELLDYYGLKSDRNGKMHCPFHDDKTPSMQVYPKTESVYCFSSNCKTHGRKINVIDFVMYKENLSVGEAIRFTKNSGLITDEKLNERKRSKTYLKQNTDEDSSERSKTYLKQNTDEDRLDERKNIDDEKLNETNENKPNETENENELSARTEYFESLFVSFRKGVYNSHPCKAYLEKRGLDYKILEIGYNSGQFHHGDRKEDQLISDSLRYGMLIDRNLTARTGEKAYTSFAKGCIVFALRNRENNIVSFYFRSIIDTKTAKHFYLKNRQGLYPQYPDLNTKKLILTESIIDCASLLQIEEINKHYSILACYGTNGLLKQHKEAIGSLKDLEEIIFCFDNDDAGKKAVRKYAALLNETKKDLKFSTVELPAKDINEVLQGHEKEVFVELLAQREELIIDNDRLNEGSKTHLTQNTNDENRLNEGSKTHLTQNTDENRLNEIKNIDKTESKILRQPIVNNQGVISFLKEKDLLERLNAKIGESGIVGEEQSRLLLFLIIISYVNSQPLHGLMQGSSGSGKTHLISKIADLMPKEDVLRFTRITESSLYNWGEFDLFQKIIIIEDLDGLKEDALYALREFISNQKLSSSVTIKDRKGKHQSAKKEVRGQFSSLSATTKGETYEDNMNRSFVLATDESEAQTQRIIDYQNQRNAGEISTDKEKEAVLFIQELVRHLKDYEVVNPYASKITLPSNVKNKRRLNEMFQSVVKQVTFLNQYQRRLSTDHKLITEIEDIREATEVLFESIVLKIDELDGSLRQFLEGLKSHFKDRDFTRFDAMAVSGFKKTQLQFYLNELLRLEYLKQSGHANRGYKYKLGYLDNIQKVRDDLKTHFIQQLEGLSPT